MPVLPQYESQVVPDIGSTPRVNTGAEAIAQGVSNLGAGIEDAAAGFSHLARRYNEIQTQTNDFDDQAKLRAHIQQRQNDLETAKQNMPASATGFTQSYMQSTAKSDQDFLATISPQNQKHYQEQLVAVNENFHGLAADAERQGRSAFETNNVQQAYNGYENTVRTDPSQRAAAQADLFKSIDAMTAATPQQKIEMKQKIDSGMAFQQALGEAGNDPAKMKTLVWGSQSGAGASSAPGGGDVHSNVLLAAVSKGEGAGDYNKVFANGQFGNTPKPVTQMTVDEAAQWADQHRHKNNPDNPHPAAPLGAYQFVGSTIKALKNQMGLKGNELMSPQLQDAMAWQNLKNTRGNPAAIRAQWTSWAGKSDAEIHQLWEQGFKQHEGHAPPSDYPTGGPAAAGALNEDKAGVPSSSIAPDSRFSSLTPEQRDSLVETAGRNFTAQNAAVNAAATQAQKALVDDLQTGIINNQIGTSDIKQQLDRQQITPDDYLKLQGQIEKRDKDAGDAGSFIDGMKNNATFNRFDTQTKDHADAAFKQMGGSLEALDTIYQKSGIVPASAVSQMRTAIFGQNAQSTSQALQIGANIMAGNPNAFKGVDGGEDIQNAVVKYNHFIGTGDSTQSAVQKVMQQNDPNYRPTVKVTDTDLKTFQDNITASSISSSFSQWFPNWYKVWGNPQIGGDPQQQSEIVADFKQVATDAYQQSGDPKLAMAQAKDQLSRVYGVSNAFGSPTLTKYPPEKAYPPVANDTNGGYGYISRQAIDAIKQETGHDVDPANVTLLPIPGSTQSAFAANQPVPYQLAYTWTRPDGQQQHDVIYGKGFVADPAAAQKQIHDAAQPGFEALDAWRQSGLQQDQAAREQLKSLYGGILTTNTQPSQVEIDENARAAANTAKAKAITPPPVQRPINRTPTSGSGAFQQEKQIFSPTTDVFGGT